MVAGTNRLIHINLSNPPMRTFFALVALCVGLLSCKTNSKAVVYKEIPAQPSALLEANLVGANQDNPERAKVTLSVHETVGTEPIMGATCVLQRQESVTYYGQLTDISGRCNFDVQPGHYTLKVQLTGMTTYEMPPMMLEAGKTYKMAVAMGRAANRQQ